MIFISNVGRAVVTLSEGRLALDRLGALCEQLKELNSQGYEIIFVTLGAVGLGCQRIRYRKLVNSRSPLDLELMKGSSSMSILRCNFKANMDKTMSAQASCCFLRKAMLFELGSKIHCIYFVALTF
ncbi:hypothetical protein ACOSQ4_017504 [Xanthoceras sorbifolium]